MSHRLGQRTRRDANDGRLRRLWWSSLLPLLLSGCDSLLTKPTLYGSVTAQVTRRNGAPVSGARLVLYTGQRPMGYAVTDSNGSYTFLDVPEGVYGVLAVPPTGYAKVEDISASAPTDVIDKLTVLAQGKLDARFTFLKVGLGSVIAQVNEPDGTPVSQIAVTLYAPSGAVARGVTDAVGKFVFDGVPLGNYGVFAARPQIFLDSGETPLPSRAGLIVDEQSRETAAFVFARCTGSIAALVRDSTGRPVPGAILTFYTGSGKIEDAVVGTDGRRTFGSLLCADYGLRVQLPRGWTATEGRGVTFLDGLRVRRGSALTATLTVVRVGRAIVRVRILDQTDAAVPNARVVLYTGAGLARDVVTAADGTVSMDDILVNEEYGVRVVNPRGYLATEGRGNTFLDAIRLIDGEVRQLEFRFFKP